MPRPIDSSSSSALPVSTPSSQGSSPTDPSSATPATTTALPPAAVTPPLIHTTQTNVVTGLLTTSLAVSKATPRLQDALRDALLDYMPTQVATTCAAMTTEEWASVSLTLYSFGGNTRAITDVLDEYAAKPLIQRASRFHQTSTAQASC